MSNQRHTTMYNAFLAAKIGQNASQRAIKGVVGTIHRHKPRMISLGKNKLVE